MPNRRLISVSIVTAASVLNVLDQSYNRKQSLIRRLSISFPEEAAGMTEEKKVASERIDETAEQTIDLAREAMESYLDFLHKTMLASHCAQAELSQTIQSYARRNLASVFDVTQKLTKAKDLHEVVQIQTEFMQNQFRAFQKQIIDPGERTTNTATDVFKLTPPTKSPTPKIPVDEVQRNKRTPVPLSVSWP